jgi:hypothetical protein
MLTALSPSSRVIFNNSIGASLKILRTSLRHIVRFGIVRFGIVRFGIVRFGKKFLSETSLYHCSVMAKSYLVRVTLDVFKGHLPHTASVTVIKGIW